MDQDLTLHVPFVKKKEERESKPSKIKSLVGRVQERRKVNHKVPNQRLLSLPPCLLVQASEKSGQIKEEAPPRRSHRKEEGS